MWQRKHLAEESKQELHTQILSHVHAFTCSMVAEDRFVAQQQLCGHANVRSVTARCPCHL